MELSSCNYGCSINIQPALGQKIIIMDLTPHGDVVQDLEWGETHPVGGSETATMNMTKSLQLCGYEVEIVTDRLKLAGKECDIFVANRRWEIFLDGQRPGRLNYLWCHDDVFDGDPGPLSKTSIANKVYAACDGVIFLSHYQQRRWLERLNVPLEKTFLSSNGIPLHKFSVQYDNLAGRLPWAYYASTPFRGLAPLLASWPQIKSAVKGAQLHVFSSMQVYNEKEEESFNELYDLAKSLDGVHYHGSVGQAQLREVAQMCRVLAYPCIFPETSCICALEAMAAGCVVAGTAIGALPETAWQNPLIPDVDGWLSQWMFTVARVLADDNYYERLARQNLITASYYDWNLVAQRWRERFKLDSIKKTASNSRSL